MGRNLHLIQAFIIFNLFIHSSKGQLAAFCELPAERGPCNKLELRYRFSEESEYCQTFLYGGCEGNRNNFLSLKDCVKSCVDEVVPRCELPKDPGTCFHANQVRYFFNEDKEICEKFYFSGCQGNANNFRTAQECRQTCGGFPVMDDTTTQPPQVESWIEPSQSSWYTGAGSRSSSMHGSSEVTYVNPRTNRKLTFVNNNPNAPRQPQQDHNQYNSHYRNRGESNSQPAPHSYRQVNRQYSPGPNNGRPNNGNPNNGRHNNGRHNNGRPNNSRPNNGRPNNGRPNNGPPPQPHRQNGQMRGQAPNPRGRGNHPPQHESGPVSQMEHSHHNPRHPPTNQNNRQNNRRPNNYPQRESVPPMQRNSPNTPSRRPQNRQQQTNRQNQNMRRNRHSQHSSRRNSPNPPNSPHGNQNPPPQRNEPYTQHQRQRNHNTRHENHRRRPAPGSFEQEGPQHSPNNMPERPNYNWNRGPTHITTTPQTREWNNWADQSNSKTYPKPPNDWNQPNTNPSPQPGRWNTQQQGPPAENKWESPNKYPKAKNQKPPPHWNAKPGTSEPNNNWQSANQKPPNEWNSGPKGKPNSQFKPPSWPPPDTQTNNGGWEPISGPPKEPPNNNNNNNPNNNLNNGPPQKLDRIPIVERREFSWGETPTQDYSNGFSKPYDSTNNWQNNPGPSQDPTNAPSNSIKRQSDRTNNRQPNQDQHFSESMSFKRRRGPGKGNRRSMNVNNRKNIRKQGRWSRNGDRFPTDTITPSDQGNKNSTPTDAWPNYVPRQQEQQNTPGNMAHERVNTPYERGNGPRVRGNTLHGRGNTQRERGNTQREAGNTQHERVNTNPNTQNVPPTPSNPPDWSISQNGRSENIGEWSNNPTVDINQREWPTVNAPPTTPEQPNPPNHWDLNNNFPKRIEPGPNNRKAPMSRDIPPWEKPVDNQGPGLQWLSSNSNTNNNNNNNNNIPKEPQNTNNNKEWQSSHTNNNVIPPSPTPTWINNNEVVEQPFGGGGGSPMFEWLSKDTAPPQGNNNVNNYERNTKPKDNTQNSQGSWRNSPSDPVPHLENFSAADIIKKQRIKLPSSNALPIAQDALTTLQPQNETWSTFDSNGAFVIPMTSEPYTNQHPHNNNNNNNNQNSNNNNNIYNNNNNNNHNNNPNNNEVYPSSYDPTPTNSFPEFLNGPPQRRAFEYQPTRLSPQSSRAHPNDISNSRALDSRCFLEKDNGSCNDNILLYHYDRISRQCQIFYYTGCGGNRNKFFSRESCESTCQVQKRPVCEQDSDPGTCNRHIIKYFYNKITRRCEVYTYTGCEGNDNRFDRFDDCLATCIYKPGNGGNNVSPGNGGNNVNPGNGGNNVNPGNGGNNVNPGNSGNNVNPGNGGNNVRPGNGENNVYPGNGGNQPMTGGGGGSRCEQPIDEGACTKWTKKYAYNSKSRDCEPFSYGGCGGNSNNFNDINSCRSTCVL